MQTDYTFADRERVYFERLQMNFNTSVNAGINMICTQNALEGQWRIKQDLSGLERADVPAAAPGRTPTDEDAREVARAMKEVNGVA